MELKNILKKVDHTLLAPDSTQKQIETICREGLEYGVASVCIPQSFVGFAKKILSDNLPVCTVVGFPCGYNFEKKLETARAVSEGADEIDMVINIGWAKEGRLDLIKSEIEAVRDNCKNGILKVIIETCLLTDEEKIALCSVVHSAGADFIKTSTGFSKWGATREDVALLAANAPKGLLVKAAGGIKTLEDAFDFISLGASRLGTSRIIGMVRELEGKK